MIWSVDILLLIFVVVLAIASIEAKDLLVATVLFGGFSFLMAVIWVELNSVDVAFTEAAVGAGVSTVLMVAAIAQTARYEEGKGK
ncbi:hydrogenase subunit MbhD domain-containing protein [Methermicoccus shengliensis]|uniref:hydrogenase subunit MbhD domain-containing protein n=1 Tax=Methermicoccus shengliensis TaxID=660064 RepID=UPI0005B26926|nr:hydrogenase subunit MbhD domain-containing protein [Methermicoccus shengliensis]KUK04768.1 MAG: Monovalent cation/H+ antiporter subunit B domain protein [Euryarchaeota archaeon 55_53]KUK29928.1 MAG: Monovalent cation/H+ antiporter subunit B domain protein [Methanosarcinales archeaon 56_1174]MDI3487685.1 energy-converting hydrogenase subunit [Methanosarcinales archaeon]MDN5295551.1 energy-converting hydrogenase subunit [Methanosarcinales archaeon]